MLQKCLVFYTGTICNGLSKDVTWHMRKVVKLEYPLPRMGVKEKLRDLEQELRNEFEKKKWGERIRFNHLYITGIVPLV